MNAPQLPPITDLPQHAQDLINQFNARPMRRWDDARVQGWNFLEPAL